MASFDFNKRKKPHMTVTLPDENKTVLMVAMPSKALFSACVNLGDISANAVDESLFDDLYDLCTEILNNNKTGARISGEAVRECLDLEDMMAFLGAYTDFIAENSTAKN